MCEIHNREKEYIGSRWQCRECKKEYQARWYQEHREQRIAESAASRKKYRQEVSDYKESHSCTDCGEFYPAIVMEFDHTEDNKVGNVSQMSTSVSRKKLWEEIEKCDLVCANCHRLRTLDRLQAIEAHQEVR